MIEETMVELIEFIKNAAPEIWGVVLKQVWVEAAQYGIGAGLCVLALWIITPTYRANSKKRLSERSLEIEVFGLVVLVLAVIALPFLMSGAIGRAINPEFYAIRYLLSQLP